MLLQVRLLAFVVKLLLSMVKLKQLLFLSFMSILLASASEKICIKIRDPACFKSIYCY